MAKLYIEKQKKNMERTTADVRDGWTTTVLRFIALCVGLKRKVWWIITHLKNTYRQELDSRLLSNFVREDQRFRQTGQNYLSYFLHQGKYTKSR